MRQQISPGGLLVFILVFAVILAIVQIGALSLAFEKLGLSPASGMVLLFASMVGSIINIPLFFIQANESAKPPPNRFVGLLRLPPSPFMGKTLVTVNLGGCLMPLTFTTYLVIHSSIPWGVMMLAILLVSIICYIFSRPMSGIGIGMPFFIAPLGSAIVAILLFPENSAALAYICGTLGVIIGADLLRLKDIKNMGAPVASIGGAGTFDGIFITGIVAVLLA